MIKKNFNMRVKFILFTLIILTLFHLNSYADEPQKKQIGFDEKLGETIPLDLSFTNDNGQQVKLKDLFNKPTLFMVVYYKCPGLCSPFLGGVEKVIENLDLEAGKDYNIVTVSFDPSENYLMALEKKKNYLDEMDKKIPESSWHFLTGDSINIAKITDAVGFRYMKQGKDYIHATALISVSPNGKIARYLYGTDFNPFDVKLALIEASEGRSGPTISKLVKLCYSYDPEGRKYVLNITRIAGGGIFILIVAFVAILTLKKKKIKNKPSDSDIKTSNTNERNNLNG